MLQCLNVDQLDQRFLQIKLCCIWNFKTNSVYSSVGERGKYVGRGNNTCRIYRNSSSVLNASFVCFQGQFRDRSGASKSQAGAGRLPGQSEEGADESGLSGAHIGAKGQWDEMYQDMTSEVNNKRSMRISSQTNCVISPLFLEQRNRGVNKDLWWADRQDGEELATPRPDLKEVWVFV